MPTRQDQTKACALLGCMCHPQQQHGLGTDHVTDELDTDHVTLGSKLEPGPGVNRWWETTTELSCFPSNREMTI